MGNLVSLLAHLPRGHEAIAGASTHTVMDEAGGHAVVVGATIRALRERADGTHGPGRDRGRVPRPRRTTTSPSPASSSSRTPTPTPAAARCRWATWSASRRSRTSAACPSTWTAPGCFNAAVALGVTPAELAAPRRHRHLLPLEGPVGADRLRGGRPGAVHRPRPPRPQAPGRRDAPGGRAGGRRPRGAGRRARTGPSRASRRTTPTRAASPRAWPSSPASARPAASPSRTRTGRWTRPAP